MSNYVLHEKIGCGCCRGPEEDRCCCHIHQDIPRGLRAKQCSYHAAETAKRAPRTHTEADRAAILARAAAAR